VQRVRHDVIRREVEVVRVENLAPHLRSIVFAGETLANFVSDSFDDHVKVMFDADTWRDYTPRRFDRQARELTIEFVLHGDGPAANWAAQARPGQGLTIGGPRGSFIVPMDYQWHLLVGDETALPAIARRVEELPASTRAIVIAQAADVADQRRFESAAALGVQWVLQTSELVSAVRGLALPDGEGYVWCAGESGSMAEIRAILVGEKHHDRHGIRAAAYWKKGVLAHHENLEDR